MMGFRSQESSGRRPPRARPGSRADRGPTLHRIACLYTRPPARPLAYVTGCREGNVSGVHVPCSRHGARTGLCLSRYYCCGNWGLTREAVDSPGVRGMSVERRESTVPLVRAAIVCFGALSSCLRCAPSALRSERGVTHIKGAYARGVCRDDKWITVAR